MNLTSIADCVYKGERDSVEKLVSKALDSGIQAEDILNNGLIKGMDRVAYDFKNNTMFIPEVLLAAHTMQSGLNLLEPYLAKAGVEPVAKVAIGTVMGDIHDIGKNMVAMLMRGSGFEVIDYGFNVPPEKFVEAAESGVSIICMSALLTTTVDMMRETIETLVKSGHRDNVKIMIGGAPVTQDYAALIGADGYAPDAATAVDVAKRILGIDVSEMQSVSTQKQKFLGVSEMRSISQHEDAQELEVLDKE